MVNPASSRDKHRAPPVPRQEQPTRQSGSPGRMLAQDVENEQQHVGDLLTAQSQVLETLAKDASLTEMLEVFAKTIERQSGDMLCSILLLEGSTLRHGAAPSLPPEYIHAVDGVTIGPAVGSCGTAAFTRQQVIVADIATDPLWADYQDLALRHGLRACWSTPILGAHDKVLGTFALYYRTPREPTQHDRHLMEIWTQLAALGITRKQAEEAVKVEQQFLLHLFKAQEYERKLAAYDLHDGVAQYVAAAILHLESYLQSLSAPSLPDELETAGVLLRKTLHECRRLINGLRPPVLDEEGVVAAIEHLIQDESMAGPQITFEHKTQFQRLAPALETAIFRIAQEALTNAKNHSGSSKIVVVLKHNGNTIHLDVRDSGTGFTSTDVPNERHGLRGIRERVRLLGGKVRIDSEPGKGTAVSVDLPLLVRKKGA